MTDDALSAPVRSIERARSRVIDAGHAWGIQPDESEGIFLREMTGFGVEVVRRLETWTPVPTDDLKEVVGKAATTEIRRAASTVAIAARRRFWALLAGVAVLSAGIGWMGGWTQAEQAVGQRTAWAAAELQMAFRGGTAGAVWLAKVAASNSPDDMMAGCKATVRAQGGGKSCTISAWIEPPPAR